MPGPEIAESQSFTNLLRNGSFELWQDGGLPEYWAFEGPATGAFQSDAFQADAFQVVTRVPNKALYDLGAWSVELLRRGADTRLTQNVAATGGTVPLAHAQGRMFTLSVRVRKTTGTKARIGILDGVGSTYSGFCCETDTFQVITISHTVATTATKLEVVLEVIDTDGGAYFDGAMLVEGNAIPGFYPNPGDWNDPINNDTTAPDTPAAPGTETTVTLDTDGGVRSVLIVSWTVPNDPNLWGYQVDYRRQGDTAWTSRMVLKSESSYRATDVVGNTTYEVRVRAIDIWGRASSPTAVQTIVTAGDTTAPAAPTAVSVTAGFQLNVIRWTPPADADWDVVEIWRATTNDSAAATKVGEHRGIMWVDDKLDNNTTYYYWLKARDTSGNKSAFHAASGAGVSGTTQYIQNADIESLTADKITAGTVDVLLKLGVDNIELDGVNDYILIKDSQGTPVTRVKLGKLGAGAQDWGLQIWNASGDLMWTFDGGVQNAGIGNLAVSTGKVANDAITADGVYENTAQKNVDGEDIETEMGSVTISTDGGTVLVIVSGTLFMETTGEFRIRKGSITGSVLVYTPILANGNFTVVARDASPSSSQTYVMTYQGNGNDYMTYRRMYTLNRKK